MSIEFLPIAFRELTRQDHPLIYSTWLKSYRESMQARCVSKTIYFREHHHVISELLARGHCLVAYHTNDEDQLFGWITYEQVPKFWVLHYLYVKHSYRELGIAKALVRRARADSEDPLVYTHMTMQGEMLARKLRGIFNPYWGK